MLTPRGAKRAQFFEAFEAYVACIAAMEAPTVSQAKVPFESFRAPHLHAPRHPREGALRRQQQWAPLPEVAGERSGSRCDVSPCCARTSLRASAPNGRRPLRYRCGVGTPR